MSVSYDDGWKPVVDKFAGFYYNSSGRTLVKIMFHGMSLLGIPFMKIPKALIDPEFRRLALIRMVMRFDPTSVKLLASFGNSPINKYWTPFVEHGFQPNRRETVFIERQRKFMVDYNMGDQAIFLKKDSNAFLWGRKPVRCRLLKSEVSKEDSITEDTLLINVHGGGFLTGTPDTHEVRESR